MRPRWASVWRLMRPRRLTWAGCDAGDGGRRRERAKAKQQEESRERKKPIKDPAIWVRELRLFLGR
uniref:Uncharacterized protein n=1 Tax=uncultured marine virus TaxID=186617 RepID=A0A0F7L9E9_9VIRU|nr:hypothetical protein [uncultured marine virus]